MATKQREIIKELLSVRDRFKKGEFLLMLGGNALFRISTFLSILRSRQGRGDSNMTFFGIAVTAIYIIIILTLRLSSLSTLTTMPLNEFGDFFAGVFGPLTLFWL